MSLESFLATLASSGNEIDRLLLSLASRDIRTRGPAQRKLLRWPTSEVEEGLLALLRTLDFTHDPFLTPEELRSDQSMRGTIQYLFSQRGKRAQATLFDALDDPLPLVRETAICALGAMGNPEAFPGVYQALIHDPQLEQHYLYVIEALASLSAPQHLDLLLPILLKGNDEQRRVTAVCIEQIGPPAVPALLPLLAHAQSAVRGIAAALLGTLHDPHIIDALIAMLKDSDAHVRCQSVQALHQLRAHQALPALREALHDVAFEVREAALLAVARLDEAQAFQTYCDALQDPDPDIRSQALVRLGYLKDPRAADVLVSALHDPIEWVRPRALSALAELGDKRALEPLLAALADPEQRASAATSLGVLGDPRAVEPLLGALAASQEGIPLENDPYDGELAFVLHDSSGWDRDCIIIALCQLGDPRATEAVIAALDDPGYYVQQSAYRGLGTLGDQRAVAPLLKRLREKQNASVAKPLVELGGPQALEGLYEVLLGQQHYSAYMYHDVARALRPLQQPVPAILFTRVRQAETIAERETAAIILGALGDPQAYSTLLNVINDTQENLSVRNTAVRALGELDGERALEPLLSLLTSEPLSILRAQAAHVLGTLKPPEALHPLLNALNDPASLVRAIAARSLENFHDPQVIPALQAMIAREIAQEDNFEEYIHGMSYFPRHLHFADRLPEEHAQTTINHYEFTKKTDALAGKVIIFRTDSSGLHIEPES